MGLFLPTIHSDCVCIGSWSPLGYSSENNNHTHTWKVWLIHNSLVLDVAACGSSMAYVQAKPTGVAETIERSETVRTKRQGKDILEFKLEYDLCIIILFFESCKA